MRCLVRNCPADENLLKNGIDVSFTWDGEEQMGRVCEHHKGLVVDNMYAVSIDRPKTLDPIPAKENLDAYKNELSDETLSVRKE